MGSLVYLIGIVVFVLAVSMFLFLKDAKPVSTEQGVESFSKGMQALASSKSARGQAPRLSREV